MIAIVSGTIAVEDRYAKAEEVEKGFALVNANLSALEVRIRRGELEASQRNWLTIRYDMEDRFGMDCERCSGSQLVQWTTAISTLDKISRNLDDLTN
jgi:hypothetical protein